MLVRQNPNQKGQNYQHKIKRVCLSLSKEASHWTSLRRTHKIAQIKTPFSVQRRCDLLTVLCRVVWMKQFQIGTPFLLTSLEEYTRHQAVIRGKADHESSRSHCCRILTMGYDWTMCFLRLLIILARCLSCCAVEITTRSKLTSIMHSEISWIVQFSRVGFSKLG